MKNKTCHAYPIGPREEGYYLWANRSDSFPVATAPKLPRTVRNLKGFQRGRWKNQRLNLRATEVARSFLESAPFPESIREIGRRALGLFSKDPHASKALLKTVAVSEFGNAMDYLLWAQFIGLFIKSGDGGSPDARKKRAWAGFVAAEEKCRRSNRRLAHYFKHPERMPEAVRAVMWKAKSLISEVLGTLSPAVLEELIALSRPGGGVSIGTVDRTLTGAEAKLCTTTTELCVSERALPYARIMVENSPAWASHLAAETATWQTDKGRFVYPPLPYRITSFNRVSFVSKDAAVDRTIAVEPALNMWLQLGVHKFVARRLRSFGVDISRQSRNQEYARQGARDWYYVDPKVTIDLKSASDSVCIELVRYLLPRLWAEYLDDIRSPAYVDENGTTQTYQKWSSMGNGYTFVLETLIFWALATACDFYSHGESQAVAVYGDDIIVRRSAAFLLIEVLQFAGFAINPDKTFLFGEFRESCGADWYGRNKVSPIYLRGLRKLAPTDVYRLANGLRRLGIDTPEVMKLLFQRHAAKLPVLRGSGGDEASCWFTADPGPGLKSGVSVRYQGQIWCCFAKFVSRKVRVSPSLRYASALLQGGDGDGDGEVWNVARRSTGFWSVGVRLDY